MMMNKKVINLIGIPYDEKSSFMQGPALAPDKIRETFDDGSANYFSENGTDIKNDLILNDLGNLDIKAYTDIKKALSEKINGTDKFIFLGGDHSVSFPVIDALSKYHKGFDILHFDAHSDTYDEFEGDRYSHACPFARIMELGVVNRLVQVGIRTLTNHQREQIDKFGIEVIEMKDIDEMWNLKFNNDLYISIDLDGFDPAYAPGVSHHEAGGMIPRDVINFLNRLRCNVIAADIVELNPSRDTVGITAALASKLLRELCGIINN